MDSNLQDYYDIADDLINNVYAERDELFAELDKMFHLDWSMPEGVPDWVMKVISTDPRDAVMTTVRTFSKIKPQFKMLPMMNNEENRERANQIETAIGWNFRQAARRDMTGIVSKLLFSSVMYTTVAAQVVYLPYQEKILEAMGKDNRRLKSMKRFGDFAFIVHHPSSVYPTFSEYGLESVLVVRTQTFDEFKNSWGKLASAIDSDRSEEHTSELQSR